MKAAAFNYVRASSVAEAISALAAGGRVLAGGQSLVPMLNTRTVRPEVVVDVNRLTELAYIRQEDGCLAIGALTRQRAVETSSLVQRETPLLAMALPYVGHVSVRNRGTIGGSLAHAEPAAELPAVCVALDASLVVRGSGGVRTVAAQDFFTGPNQTALQPDELIVEIRVPVSRDTSCSVQELSFRGRDLAVVAAFAAIDVGPDGFCHAARISLAGAGPTPLRAHAVEQALAGQAMTDSVIDAAVAALSVDPPRTMHAPAGYRRQMASVLTNRAIRTAVHK